MLINDIEHVIRFWVDDDNGESVCDKVFASFEEMNAFLKAAFYDEKYDGLTARFSPVEVINGVPDEAVKFIYDIFPIMELESAEIEEFQSYIEDDYAESAELGVSCGKETQFTPREEADEFESKKNHRADYSYICPHCYREIDDCRCSNYPYFLVQIDTPIVPVIRVLNKKGYITSACCAGHIDQDYCANIHIAFREEHNFGHNIPDGAVYSKDARMVRFDGVDKMNAEERKIFQAECIDKLITWAEKLPRLD